MSFRSIFKALSLAALVLGFSKSALAMEKATQGPKNIFEAIYHKNIQAVTDFLDQGVPVDTRYEGRGGFTPLVIAISMQDENLVRLLLQRGADIFAPVNGCFSVIEYARDTKESIKQLILEEINKKDREVLRKAVLERDDLSLHVRATKELMYSFSSYKRVVQPFLHKLKIYNTIFEAAVDTNIDALKCFLDNGIEINSKDEFQRTLLHIAIVIQNTELFYLCLERGINIDGQNICGFTALHQAIRYKYKYFITLLVQRNARLDIKDWENKTPLDLAQSEGYEDILRIINTELESQKQKKENSHFPHAFKRLITQGLLQRHPFILDANSAAASGNDFMLANAFVLQRGKKAHCADRAFTVSSKPIEPLQPLDEGPYRFRFAVFNFLNGWASLGQDAHLSENK